MGGKIPCTKVLNTGTHGDRERPSGQRDKRPLKPEQAALSQEPRSWGGGGQEEGAPHSSPLPTTKPPATHMPTSRMTDVSTAPFSGERGEHLWRNYGRSPRA